MTTLEPENTSQKINISSIFTGSDAGSEVSLQIESQSKKKFLVHCSWAEDNTGEESAEDNTEPEAAEDNTEPEAAGDNTSLTNVTKSKSFWTSMSSTTSFY